MKKQENGFTLVELLVVIGILGVLMSALFPAITGAMRSSNMTACMANGSKLVKEMMTKEVNEEGSVFPKTKITEEGDGSEEIRTTQYSDAAKYFTDLFDLKNAQSADKHRPYVEVEMKVLWGFGVTAPSATATELKENNVLWAIAANVDSSTPDYIPFLVSRNVDCAGFTTKYTGAGSTEIGLGKANGGYSDTPFGNKGFIYITRIGAGYKIDSARDARWSKIYPQQFDISQTDESKDPLAYLLPAGTAQCK